MIYVNTVYCTEYKEGSCAKEKEANVVSTFCARDRRLDGDSHKDVRMPKRKR
jgi:hypothetical protein